MRLFVAAIAATVFGVNASEHTSFLNDELYDSYNFSQIETEAEGKPIILLIADENTKTDKIKEMLAKTVVQDRAEKLLSEVTLK